METRLIKITVGCFVGAPIVYWLQPPIYASVAIGVLIGMLVDLAVDNALRKD